MRSLLRITTLATTLLAVWVSPGVPRMKNAGGKMDAGAMDKGKMDGGAMDKGKMDGGAMDKGKMDGGAMDKGKMDGGPWTRARWTGLASEDRPR